VARAPNAKLNRGCGVACTILFEPDRQLMSLSAVLPARLNSALQFALATKLLKTGLTVAHPCGKRTAPPHWVIFFSLAR